MVTRKKDANFEVDGITEIGTRNAKCVTVTVTSVENIEMPRKIPRIRNLGSLGRDGNINV